MIVQRTLLELAQPVENPIYAGLNAVLILLLVFLPFLVGLVYNYILIKFFLLIRWYLSVQGLSRISI